MGKYSAVLTNLADGRKKTRFSEFVFPNKPDYQDEYFNAEELLDDDSDGRQKNYENFTELFEETEFASENNECENDSSSKDILVFVSFILMLRLSRTQVKMAIAIVEYFLKCSLPFTAKEVSDEVNRRRMSHAPKTRLFCPNYRALVRNQPFKSTSFSHPGPQKSQMHLMKFRKRRNTRGFGSVCLFIIRGGQSYVLIEEYGSAAALRLDFSKLARNTQRLARSIKLFADNNCALLLLNALT
ncbi:Protein CBG21761 [Caenorhabditis briggsae]|uniref:Protein CBG21761 n=1 Tax=Caenorhabditis briggsae TaxID=6238 RepID=A8Y0J7_CAEBR|nr:Protein CBG21761 [Caenorhabditis briggsae]CAP38415.1 Protein CBG21761 [Caenorhabditis briggsae]